MQAWLGERLGAEDFKLRLLCGDASFRRYFRVEGGSGERWIAMDAPPEKEQSDTFVEIAERLAAHGLHVPRIHAKSLAQGFLLLEDLGSVHYLDALDERSAGTLYGDALAALATIQSCVPNADLPPYDRAMLMREMALFREWLLERMLGLSLDQGEAAALDRICALLADNALAQPTVCVLRDYHSRNLMVCDSANPGILDFQDAVNGPVTYDLVSLLRDCYIAWPRARVRQWAWEYFDLACRSGILRSADKPAFQRWFDLMGVQRHLKAAGIFARLDARDGKPGYLKDIPRTLEYVLQLEDEYPELATLCRLIERVLVALARV
ncbi:MAG: phosphotransferase [Gammaproteobacteria bacterium]|nr:phosphotransferase [Gammaproteobacteria bacterium]